MIQPIAGVAIRDIKHVEIAKVTRIIDEFSLKSLREVISENISPDLLSPKVQLKGG
jgi:hypothetical protein